MNSILFILSFTLINITLAEIDATRIKDGKVIKHGINGLLYCALLAVAWIITTNWYLVAALCFNRLLVFNITLNLFRKLPPFYMPLQPKSIIDRIVKPVGRWVYFLYAIGFITLMFFI
jgi:hypothetical protein